MKILDHYSNDVETTVITMTADDVIAVASYPHGDYDDDTQLFLTGPSDVVVLRRAHEARWLRDVLNRVVDGGQYGEHVE